MEREELNRHGQEMRDFMEKMDKVMSRLLKGKNIDLNYGK